MATSPVLCRSTSVGLSHLLCPKIPRSVSRIPGSLSDYIALLNLAGRAQRYFVLVRISVVVDKKNVRLNAISYWRADFKLNLQRYSVLDSELLDTRWNSSAIRDTRFTVPVQSMRAAPSTASLATLSRGKCPPRGAKLPKTPFQGT